MPEVGIGFFPDVGATWLLPRLPRRIGVYLALTGLRANAGDMIALGLATSFTPSASFAALGEASNTRRVRLRRSSPGFKQVPHLRR